MPLIASSQSKARTRSFEPSPQQALFLADLERLPNHVLLEARAGSGKSTTCREGAWRLDAQGLRSTYCCFNSHIAKEFQGDLPWSCRAATLHSQGLRLLKDSLGELTIDEDKVDRLAERFFTDRDQYAERRATAKLVSLCKNLLIDAEDLAAVEELAADFDVELPGNTVDDVLAAVPEILDLCRDPQGTIDFDDIIWLPIELDLDAHRPPDVLFIDEAQDLNPCQHQLVARLSGRFKSRVVVVGDRYQSIYAWRGADADSIPNLECWLRATSRRLASYPLTVTRRCPRRVVELARSIVPDLDHLPSAPEGVVETIKPEAYTDVVKAGDMVLCRTNAPLVGACFRLLKLGVRAHVRGRDIGKGLRILIARLRARTVPDLLRRLDDYRVGEAAKIAELRPSKAATALQTLQDKCECLAALCEGTQSVDEVRDRTERLFSDLNDANAVTLSSVHRAKGLERDRVILLRPELLPGPWADTPEAFQQERNIAYVAVTRAKRELYFAGNVPALFDPALTSDSLPLTDER